MIGRYSYFGVFFLTFALGSGPWLQAQAEPRSTNNVAFDVAPAPSWAKPIKPPGDIETGVENAGTVYLLVDREEHLDRSASYYHEVRKITSQNGVQNGASISVSFNPAFEKLTIHSIQLVRDEVVSNRLDRSHIKLSPREKDPDRSTYDSSCSADMVLDDVRVGDLIEFAYTREGANPLKLGKYSSTYSMQWDFPIARNVLRLVYAANRKINFQARNSALLPTVTTANRITELSYEAIGVSARVVENDVPNDYLPRQRLEISEFQNWVELVQWAMPLFETFRVPFLPKPILDSIVLNTQSRVNHSLNRHKLMVTSRNLLAIASILISATIINSSALATPDGVYAARNGSDTTYGTIVRYGFRGTREKVPATGVNFLIALAFSPRGTLFVGGGEVIIEFSKSGGTTFANGVGGPAALAFDAAGNLFESDQSTGSIQKFTPDGVQTTFATGLSIPSGLAFDAAGNLYAGDSSGVIYKYTPQGGRSVFVSNVVDPFGLAFDKSQNLFVAERSGGDVVKITPDGVVHFFASAVNPFHLAFDAAGNLFVTDLGTATIVAISASGAETTFARIPNLAPGLAILDH